MLTNSMIMVQNFRFREVDSEPLLQYHNGCFTGFISQAAANPKAASMILPTKFSQMLLCEIFGKKQ